MWREIAPESLWVFEQPFSMKGVEIGARMTVMRLPGGGLLLINPFDYSPDVRAELDKRGTVRALLAPSHYHFLGLKGYAAAFPEAKIFVAERVPTEGLPIVAMLGNAPDLLWADALDQTIFEGSKYVPEVVFFHRASCSLILTDLSFNLGKELSGFPRLVAKLVGVYSRFGPSLYLRLSIRDHVAARASLGRVMQWDFERIIMAHGAIIEQSGREKFRHAFAWLI